MGKAPCCDGVELKKGPWGQEEDKKLLAYIQQYGHGSWRALPQKAGLRRCGKSCRLRWINYLKPDIKRGQFTTYEEQRIIQLHALLGNRWSVIAAHLPNRTDNEIKNFWNTHIKKRLTKMGIDPMTHKKKHNFPSSNQGMLNLSVIDHIAQWESTRLEAEARLAKSSNLPITEHLKTVPQEGSIMDDNFMLNPSFDILKAWRSGYANTHVGGQPYTLSFLENAVSMLAVRESSKTACVAGASGHSDYSIKNYDNFWLSKNDVAVEEDSKVSFSEVGTGDFPLFDIEDWNLEEEDYWSKFCSTTPETLFSVVYNN